MLASGKPRLAARCGAWLWSCSGSISLIQPRPVAGEVPRQQFMDPFDRMFSDSLQHLTQVILGIERMQLGGLGQRVDCRCPLAARIRPGEQPILAVMEIWA
jgi:hypothetical protein